MIPTRCPRCYSRVDPEVLEADIHICPMAPQEKRKRKPKEAVVDREPRRRPGAVSRDEYLEGVAASHGSRKCAQKGCQRPECREALNAYMRQWKAKRKAQPA